MNNQEYNDLRETSWRRALTPAETAALQKHLAANPAVVPDWQDEAELNHILDKLPATPVVSSNFTARVLAAARLAEATRQRNQTSGWFAWRNVRSWFPKAAVAALVISFTALGYHQHEANNRAALARNVVALAKAVSADPQLVEDYESIRQLSDSQPKADTELLVLMK